MTVQFDDYAKKVLAPMEKKGGVCSHCGKRLPNDYYLLLSGWRRDDTELVSPLQRFCEECWQKIERTALGRQRQLAMAV